MTSPEDKRRWVEALHQQNLDQEKLFQLIASLANLLDRDVVVETMQTILGIEPVDQGDCVLFHDLTVKFGDTGRVVGIYRTIDGNHVPVEAEEKSP